MDIKINSVEKMNVDLRSAKNGIFMQRGLKVRLLRVLSLISIDILALIAAWKVAIYYGTPLNSPWTQRASLMLLPILITIIIIAFGGLYKAGNYRRDYVALFKVISTSISINLLIAFLYEPNNYVSRSTFIIFWIASLGFIFTGRFVFETILNIVRNKGRVRHPVFLIAENQMLENYTNLLQKQNYYNVIGVSEPECLDLSYREDTFNYLHKKGVTEAFVSWNSIQNRLHLSWHFYKAGITLRILPITSEYTYPKSIFQAIGNIPCMTIPIPVIIGTDFWIKRCFDIVCSVVAIFLLLPVYLTIAILIKIDSPGSIFFKQTRIGLHGREFKMWKFRTMVANAEKLQSSLESKNENKDGVLFKMKDDPRITKIGAFLRRYSLDELPQLFNVFIGNMSLVGPRPFPKRDVDNFKRGHFIRQEVLPGITGLWQISGRSDITNFEDAVRLDIKYIENWSLWLDIEILFKTVGVIFQKTGAY